MTTRYAHEGDLPAILELFKVSLGEEGGTPEVPFWQWKHEQNPFGKSPILLAFEEDMLIGLRTFLRWRFRYQGNTFLAYRAVDTATHPAYQGKGVFRNLTSALVEDLKKGQPSVIFNTPNEKSMPGYLKMGWKMLGKTPLLVKPSPINLFLNRLPGSHKPVMEEPWPTTLRESWEAIESASKELFKNTITTDTSFEYLSWRYRDIPGFRYQVHCAGGEGDSSMVFYRIKQSGRLRELRITDIFVQRAGTRIVKKAIGAMIDTHRPDVITVVGDYQQLIAPLLPFGFINAHRLGLQVTYREVNSTQLTDLIANEKLWYFNAGSIELL